MLIKFMNKVILIGGSPTAGKSYTTRKISESLKLPWISTDSIRGQMREIVRKQDYPKLFIFADATPKMAVEFLSKNSAKDVVRYQNLESEDVWKGVEAFIQTDHSWGSFIIEGVAILPRLVSELEMKNKKIKSVFLIDENVKRIRRIIFSRGLWDNAQKYSDKVKEREVEWVLEFNNYIVNEAKKYKLPVVSIGNRIDYIGKIKKIVR